MLSPLQAENLIRRIPRGVTAEDNRAACSVVTGVRDGKSLKEITSYYWLSEDIAQKWWDFFGFSDVGVKEKKKRGSKTTKLDLYIKSNIGKILKSNEIIESCEITTPTLYNYINSNRGFFEKIKRGEYLIIDPEIKRKEDKNGSK